MNPTTDRIRKSVKMTESEHSLYKKWFDKQETKVDAEETLGITRQTLDRIYWKGSGSPENINRIREVLKTALV